jgi:hypothetical protein
MLDLASAAFNLSEKEQRAIFWTRSCAVHSAVLCGYRDVETGSKVLVGTRTVATQVCTSLRDTQVHFSL